MSFSSGKRAASASRPSFLRGLLFAAAALFTAGTAAAAVDLRVDATTNPISVYATVTNGSGQPVSGLSAGAFSLILDNGSSVSPTVTPVSGAVSVVFAMDYSDSVTSQKQEEMQDAVEEFVDTMQLGDWAAVVKFNANNGASVAKSFTAIDDVDTALKAAVQTDYPDGGFGTNIFDALLLSIQQFTGGLPGGPKAVILVSDGLDNASTADINDVISASAAAGGIPIFTIYIGAFANGTGANTLQNLATQTHGDYYAATSMGQITDAYTKLAARLDYEYKLTFPNSISGCGDHTVYVQVTGETLAESDFTACIAVYVPDLLGLTSAAAQIEVAAWQTAYSSSSGYDLTYGTETPEFSRSVPLGEVISQSPAVGSQVTADATINVAISAGPAPTTVPSVVTLTQVAATATLNVAGLELGTVTTQTSTTVVSGLVISQTPTAGTSAHENDTVNLVVSSGPPPVTVANVVGSTQAAATTTLTGQGLVVGTVTQQSSASVASGSVISQSPAAGASVASGAAVNLVVSSGPAASAPPASSGGGGATGPIEVLFGLGLVALALRRRTAIRSKAR